MNDNENDGEELYNRLKDFTEFTLVSVVFSKKNGEERHMTCTRQKDFFKDYEFKSTDEAVEKEDHSLVLPVWDVSIAQWRKIRKGSIKSVEIYD